MIFLKQLGTNGKWQNILKSHAALQDFGFSQQHLGVRHPVLLDGQIFVVVSSGKFSVLMTFRTIVSII